MSPKELASGILSELTSLYETRGWFPESGNFMTGWDRYFGLREWIQVFRTVPSLRKYLLPALAWNLVGSRREIRGFAERIIPGRIFNFQYRSFCTDLLILESMGKASRLFDVPITEACRRNASACISLAFDNRYEVHFDGHVLPMLSYYPRKDHCVPRENPVFKLFFSKDDNVPDNDTSCIILGSMLSVIELFGLDRSLYRHTERDTAVFLDLMEQHVYQEGRYGRGTLSYENGVSLRDRGVLTWVMDEHNELDPTSNIDILNYLILAGGRFGWKALPKIPVLARKILGFLGNHIERDFLDQRLQSYYPVGSTYQLWDRFKGQFDELEESVKLEFDKDAIVPRIDAHLAERGRRIFQEREAEYNLYDFLLSAPFLYSHGLMVDEISSWILSGEDRLAHFRQNHYEFFHLRYPSKIIGAPIYMPFAVILELCMRMVTTPKRQEIHSIH